MVAGIPLSCSFSPPFAPTIPLRCANALNRSCATLFDTPTSRSGSSSVSSVSDNSCPAGGPRGRYLVLALELPLMLALALPFPLALAFVILGVRARGTNGTPAPSTPRINSSVATLPTSRVDATGTAAALFVCFIIGARMMPLTLLRTVALLDAMVGASAVFRRRTGGCLGATGGI